VASDIEPDADDTPQLGFPTGLKTRLSVFYHRVYQWFIGRMYMATAPLTTVLIDTYNYGRFIEQAIDSVLAQEFPQEQLEIIVVDDGSTDDTAERVKRYGSRIKYLYKQNGGQASAFNAGLAHARGEYICLLDADDYFLPGKLSRVYEAFQAHPDVGMIYHKLPQMHMDGTMAPAPGFHVLNGFLPADKRKLASYSAHQTSCLAFRRRALQELLPAPESMRIQADAYLELVAVLITPVLGIPEELAIYRIHGNNLCATDVMDSSRDGTERLLRSTGIVIREVEGWIHAHRQRIGRVNAQRLLNRMMLPVTERQFEFNVPNRLSYFVLLLRRNYTFSPMQSWRVTTFKYLTAFAGLFFGYKTCRRLMAWGRKNLSIVREQGTQADL
jgi:glycosyltransferase involved in cell wall biosynthesis